MALNLNNKKMQNKTKIYAVQKTQKGKRGGRNVTVEVGAAHGTVEVPENLHPFACLARWEVGQAQFLKQKRWSCPRKRMRPHICNFSFSCVAWLCSCWETISILQTQKHCIPPMLTRFLKPKLIAQSISWKQIEILGVYDTKTWLRQKSHFPKGQRVIKKPPVWMSPTIDLRTGLMMGKRAINLKPKVYSLSTRWLAKTRMGGNTFLCGHRMQFGLYNKFPEGDRRKMHASWRPNQGPLQ